MDVDGYTVCEHCGGFEVTEIAVAGRYCRSCTRELAEQERNEAIAFEVEGREFLYKAPPPKRSTPNKKNKQTPSDPRWAVARYRALRRLAQIYGPMYELLLAEEKAKAGMNPTLRRLEPRPTETLSAIADLAAARHRKTLAEGEGTLSESTA